jgi:hypothetical protein
VSPTDRAGPGVVGKQLQTTEFHRSLENYGICTGATNVSNRAIGAPAPTKSAADACLKAANPSAVPHLPPTPPHAVCVTSSFVSHVWRFAALLSRGAALRLPPAHSSGSSPPCAQRVQPFAHSCFFFYIFSLGNLDSVRSFYCSVV